MRAGLRKQKKWRGIKARLEAGKWPAPSEKKFFHKFQSRHDWEDNHPKPELGAIHMKGTTPNLITYDEV